MSRAESESKVEGMVLNSRGNGVVWVGVPPGATKNRLTDMTRKQSKAIFIATEVARINIDLLKVHPYFRQGISGQIIGHLERIANTPTKLFSTKKPGLNIARHKAYERSLARRSLSFGGSVFTVRPEDVNELEIDMIFPSGVVTIENSHNR